MNAVDHAQVRRGRLSGANLKTYRYLRVGIVAMAVLLGVSLTVEIVTSTDPVLGSISAYYYTPVRNVFVGALTAIGLGLIAIAGRPGWEDSMLNLAGMLAPLVAFVPAALEEGSRDQVAAAGQGQGGDQVAAGVGNNVGALVVVGLLALAFSWATMGRPDPATRWGFLVTALVWVGVAVWFVGWPDAFRLGAHYVAAVLLFALIAGVALVNARRIEPTMATRGLSVAQLRGAYVGISVAMTVVVLVAGGLAVWQWLGEVPFDHGVFWVEAALLLLFTAFWVLQTMEYWEEGLPEEAQ
jgi:hypothetical protein